MVRGAKDADDLPRAPAPRRAEARPLRCHVRVARHSIRHGGHARSEEARGSSQVLRGPPARGRAQLRCSLREFDEAGDVRRDERPVTSGLASNAYLHFTSPIRRYPDLVVHRIVHEVLSGREARRDDETRGRLSESALASSIAERRAMEVERAIVDLYRTFLMKEHVGKRFEGTVTAVVGSGVFVAAGLTVRRRPGTPRGPGRGPVGEGRRRRPPRGRSALGGPSRPRRPHDRAVEITPTPPVLRRYHGLRTAHRGRRAQDRQKPEASRHRKGPEPRRPAKGDKRAHNDQIPHPAGKGKKPPPEPSAEKERSGEGGRRGQGATK